jgi:hypothetical protein
MHRTEKNPNEHYADTQPIQEEVRTHTIFKNVIFHSCFM